MLARIIGLIFFLGGIYILLIFLSPEIADQYGNKEINTKIRNIKNYSLDMSSGSTDPKSLIDNLTNAGKNVMSDAEKVTKDITHTVDIKVKQVQQATDAVGDAVGSVKTATHAIKNVVNKPENP